MKVPNMNEVDSELCLKEISSDILDSGKTVNISVLSENWSMSLKSSAATLEKWMNNCAGGKPLVKQFLVRGSREDGSTFMTIASEEKIPSLSGKLSEGFPMLYSIRLGPDTPTIVTPLVLETKRKRIQLSDSGSQRESHKEIDSPPLKNEASTQKGSQPFATANSLKITNGVSSSKSVKTEPKSPTKHQTSTKTEKISPKKKSPIKKEVGKKNGLIGSFFSAKSQTKSEKVTSPPIEKEIKKENGKPEESKSEKHNGKRSSVSNGHSESDEQIPAESTDNPPKRRKVEQEKKKARSKGSRIMLMADSDEDEVKSEPETSGKESDEMEEPEQSNNVEEEKKETKISSPNLPKTGKSKKRRIVTKTYEDEDGFIRTVKESEEYSSSEPEDAPSDEKTVKLETVESKLENKEPQTKGKGKTVKPPSKPATKQGSIMSFFTKK